MKEAGWEIMKEQQNKEVRTRSEMFKADIRVLSNSCRELWTFHSDGSENVDTKREKARQNGE